MDFKTQLKETKLWKEQYIRNIAKLLIFIISIHYT